MVRAARVRHSGKHVILEAPNGEIPWKQALKIGRALIAAARMAEAEDKAELIIADAALGIRAGMPIGIAPTAAHGDEAMKRAQWDAEYRRVPMVNGQGVVYAPTVRRGK